MSWLANAAKRIADHVRSLDEAARLAAAPRLIPVVVEIEYDDSNLPCEFCAFHPTEAFELFRTRALVSMHVFTCASCADMLGRAACVPSVGRARGMA